MLSQASVGYPLFQLTLRGDLHPQSGVLQSGQSRSGIWRKCRRVGHGASRGIIPEFAVCETPYSSSLDLFVVPLFGKAFFEPTMLLGGKGLSHHSTGFLAKSMNPMKLLGFFLRTVVRTEINCGLP